MIDSRRIVGIFVGDSGAQRRTGTGYWIGGDLVVTASSACPASGDGVLLSFAGTVDRPYATIVVWHRPDLGFSLIRISDSSWDAAENAENAVNTRFGCFTGGLEWAAATVAGSPLRQVEVNPLHRHAAHDWALRSADAVMGADAELAGAALFVGDLFAGIITGPPTGATGLTAAAVSVPAADAEFRRLVEMATGEPLRLVAIELDDAFRRWTPTGPVVTAADLIDPARAAIPFTGREPELERLRAWCHRGTALAGLLVTGAAGAGKSRLARQLAEQLANRGWLVGELSAGRPPTRALRHLSSVDTPVLIVVDPVDQDQGPVEVLVEHLMAEPGRSSVRLLLVARSAGSWWGRWRDRLGAAGLAFEPEPLRLSPWTVDATDEGVATAVADRLGLTVDPEAVRRYVAGVEPASTPGWLTAVAGVVFTAKTPGVDPREATTDLTATRPPAPAPSTEDVPAEPVPLLLARAEADWAAAATQTSDLPGWRDAILVAMVHQPSDRAAALDMLGRLAALTGPDREPARERVASWLHALCPPRDPATAYWAPPLPAVLAEHYLRAHPAPAPLLTVIPHLGPAAARTALAAIDRAAVGSPALVALLRNLVADHLETLAVPAVEVVGWVDTPGPLLAAVALVTGTDRLPRHVCAAMVRVLPVPGGVIAEVGVQLRRRLIAALDAEAPARTRTGRPELGHQLTLLSDALAEVGRPVEGLEAARRAVAVHEDLVRTEPAIAAVPGLLAATRAQGDRHVELNQDEAAWEQAAAAVRLCRELAQAPVAAAYAGWLGDALVHLVRRLTPDRLDAAEGALREAVAWYRRAADDQQWPALAVALRLLADRLVADGQLDEAIAVLVECVAVHEQLAELTPAGEVGRLGAARLALAELLHRRGDLGAALDLARGAVETLRRLARGGSRVDRLVPALVCYADLLAATGRRWDAVAATQEAVELARAANPPDATDLIVALTATMLRWDEVDRRDRSAEVAHELVEQHRLMWTVVSGQSGVGLAAALVNLSARLGAAGHLDRALGNVNEAIAILRIEAAEQGDTPDSVLGLAAALNNRAIILGEAGGEQALVQAVVDARSAVELLATAGAGYELEQARAVGTLSLRLAATGDRAGSLIAAEEAVALLRPHVEAAGTGRTAADWALALLSLAERCVEAGRWERAASVALECRVAIDRAKAGGAELPAESAAVSMLLAELPSGVSPAQAISAARAATTGYRMLAGADPIEYLEPSARAAETLTRLLDEAGHLGQALATAREVVAIRENLAAGGSPPEQAAFAAALGVLSRLGHRAAGDDFAGEGYVEALINGRRAHEVSLRIRDRMTLLRAGSASADWLSRLLAERPLRNRLDNPDRGPVADLERSGGVPPAGDLAESLVAANIAITWYRELVAAEPTRYDSELASALHHRSQLQTVVGNHDHALSSAREAATLLRALATGRPELRPELAQVLSALGALLIPTDPAGVASRISILRESVVLYEGLLAEAPARYAGPFELALARLVRYLKDGGRRYRKEYDRRQAQLGTLPRRFAPPAPRPAAPTDQRV